MRRHSKALLARPMAPAWKANCNGNLLRLTQGAGPDELAALVESTSLADGQEAVAEAVDLPVGVITLFLKKLHGDTASLCSAACVSTTWRVAAKDAWTVISVGNLRRLLTWHASPRTWVPSPLALRMDSDVFARLVRVAGASLRSLNVSGAVFLKDSDLKLLKRPACPSLRNVSILGIGSSFEPSKYKMSITASGIVTALKGRKLACLEVDGIDKGAIDGPTILKELRALVRKPKQLDIECICYFCERLIKKNAVEECLLGCGETWCNICRMDASFAAPLCESCGMGPNEDEEDEEDEEGDFGDPDDW
jgi:hypothetical protein